MSMPPPPAPSVPAPPAPSSAGAITRAQLSDKSGATVVFGFNPQKISISHSAKRQEKAEQTSSNDHQNQPHDKGNSGNSTHLFHYVDTVTGVGATSITLSDLLFDGDKAADDCAQ